ncbi:MAG: 1-deoxy-D-xylulose-5-phosphate synthase [Firmicutes bacterium]|nr:1-deoxy-D-xylulose-5-phosphate synthase [Bacillota bacterium]
MSNLLKRISSPRDIQNLNWAELSQLAAEIRQEIIETVSRNGGHLAPNLGIVELTLALHRVFDSPRDKIIWDVGHQCYVHKLITGRSGVFGTLRRFGGISGFPRRAESEHDPFGAGHASTSISAALGMAAARDLAGEDYSVVAVIGDGAMTGGMAFEALNHAGHLKKNLIVVLNDNEMSIAQNVGALSGYLSRLRTDPMYSRGKEEVEQILKKIPIGSKLLRLGERIKDSLKYLVVPGMIFEELGFIYLGPVDGHDIKAVSTLLKQAQSTKGPVLVHVLTKKGKGYRPAENNPDKYHGIGPFDVKTGATVRSGGAPTYTEVFGRTITRLARADERILAITAAMPSGTGLTNFSRLYPERFFDVGIAEQHAVTLAAGLAAGGYRPVVAVYSTFLQRAYDQVLHDVCLQNLPVTFALDRGGIVGEDGATHHGLFDFSYLRSIPNIMIMAPKDENEFQHMLATAVGSGVPAAVRYPRAAGTGCPMDKDFRTIPAGTAELLREGKDLAILAVGNLVRVAVEAADLLHGRGLSAAVINARFVKPLDEKLIIEQAARTGRIFTLEEHVLAGGFGSAVLELLSDKGMDGIQLRRFGVPDVFVEHGTPALLRARYGLTAEQVARSIEGACSFKQRKGKLLLVKE